MLEGSITVSEALDNQKKASPSSLNESNHKLVSPPARDCLSDHLVDRKLQNRLEKTRQRDTQSLGRKPKKVTKYELEYLQKLKKLGLKQNTMTENSLIQRDSPVSPVSVAA
jgi:hypothetical protein